MAPLKKPVSSMHDLSQDVTRKKDKIILSDVVKPPHFAFSGGRLRNVSCRRNVRIRSSVMGLFKTLSK